MDDLNKNNSIRVCFNILRAYPLFNPDVKSLFGGSEVDLYMLATELAKDKNFEVSFVVGDYGQEPTEIHKGVRVIKSADVNKNLFLGSGRIWQALRKANAQIYMGKTFSLNTFLEALFCKINRCKYIYRTASADECNGKFINQHPIRGKTILWALQNAQKVLTQNYTDAKNLLETANISSEVIRNGHLIPPLQQSAKNTILWAGRSSSYKKPYLFLDLARALPNEHFTMVCQKAPYDKNYDRLVQMAGQIKNLNFLPTVDFEKIDGYFQKAKVLVNTSDFEGFPNTFIQAGICATPILSLNVNPDGFLDKYNCGLSCGGDWQKFVDGLHFLLTEKRYIQFGQNTRKYVEENHDIAKNVEQYKKLFARLMENQKA
jgi:glycosyltransferase involved in cell wall biosynthesis